MFDDNQGIADIPQSFQGRKQLVIIPLMQANRRLVEDIQNPYQTGTDLCCQTNTLAFAARQCCRRTGQGQIFQADRLQKSQTCTDFLENLFRDHPVTVREFELIDKFQRFGDRHPAELVNIDTADSDSEVFRFQTRAMAVGTKDTGHNLCDFLPNPAGLGFPETAFEVVDNTFKFGVIGTGTVFFLANHVDTFAVCTVQNRVFLRTSEFFPGCIQRKAVMLGKCLIIHLGNRSRIADIPAGSLDCAASDGEFLIRDDHCRVDFHKRSQTGTLGAGTLRVIEREHSRFQFADRNAMFRAGIRLRKGDILSCHVSNHQPISQ